MYWATVHQIGRVIETTPRSIKTLCYNMGKGSFIFHPSKVDLLDYVKVRQETHCFNTEPHDYMWPSSNFMDKQAHHHAGAASTTAVPVQSSTGIQDVDTCK